MLRLPLVSIICSLCFLPGILNAQEDTESIGISTNTVILNAYITDRAGKPVRELPQNLFTILENGAEQKITFFEAQSTPFAVAILLDSSGSMEERIVLARAAALHFLDSLRPRDVAAVYTFDSKIREIRGFHLGRDLPESFYEVRSRGMTVLYDAIVRAAIELEKRPEKRRAILVLSDGADTQSAASKDKALKAASKADAVIYSVDMSPTGTIGGPTQMNQRALKELSDKTGGEYVRSSGGVEMREAFQRIADELGTQYTLAYDPSDEKMDGKWRSIELKIRRPNLNIRTRRGYFAIQR
ncbi:MAG: VWA domain-containing protein [Acidobacteriota bacterium]|nr:MAG: VWA domain-containing protein [Acidobacteriota bacterium]